MHLPHFFRIYSNKSCLNYIVMHFLRIYSNKSYKKTEVLLITEIDAIYASIMCQGNNSNNWFEGIITPSQKIDFKV